MTHLPATSSHAARLSVIHVNGKARRGGGGYSRTLRARRVVRRDAVVGERGGGRVLVYKLRKPSGINCGTVFQTGSGKRRSSLDGRTIMSKVREAEGTSTSRRRRPGLGE